jgi:hypothetical protein
MSKAPGKATRPRTPRRTNAERTAQTRSKLIEATIEILYELLSRHDHRSRKTCARKSRCDAAPLPDAR